MVLSIAQGRVVLPAEMVAQILYWLDSREDWRWLVLQLVALYGGGLGRDLPLMMNMRQLLDRRDLHAFAVAKYGDRGGTPAARLVLLTLSTGQTQSFSRYAPRMTPECMHLALLVAATCGREEVVRQLLERGADLEGAELAASCGGHVSILTLLAARGDARAEVTLGQILAVQAPDDRPSTLAAWGEADARALLHNLAQPVGFPDLPGLHRAAEWMTPIAGNPDDPRVRRTIDFHSGFVDAAGNNEPEVLEIYHDSFGVRRYGYAMLDAVENGCFETADLLLRWEDDLLEEVERGTPDQVRAWRRRHRYDIIHWPSCVLRASWQGWAAMLRWIHERVGIPNLDEALSAAASRGHLGAVRQLQAYGARGYRGALAAATESSHLEVAAQLRVWIAGRAAASAAAAAAE